VMKRSHDSNAPKCKHFQVLGYQYRQRNSHIKGARRHLQSSQEEQERAHDRKRASRRESSDLVILGLGCKISNLNSGRRRAEEAAEEESVAQHKGKSTRRREKASKRSGSRSSAFKRGATVHLIQ